MDYLDRRCAEEAKEILEKIKDADKNKIENIITKSLGVLQEDGVYAFFIYLKASKDKNIANAIVEESIDLLKQCDGLLDKNTNSDNILQSLLGLMSNIDKLFLAKELLERTLVYARYHAKALPEKQKGD